MSSPAEPSLQDWLNLIQANQAKLAKQVERAQALQQEIQSLERRAQTDPKARAALQQLEQLATSDWEPMRQKLEKAVARLQKHARPAKELAQTPSTTPVTGTAAIRRTYL